MSRKVIGWDVRMWDHPGIGRYIRELTSAIIKKRPAYELRLLASSDKFSDTMFAGGGVTRERCVYSDIYSVLEQIEMPIRTCGLDLLHVPHFNVPVLYPGRLVVTVHDLIYVRQASASRSRFGQAYARFLFNFISKKAAAVITVSKHTRRDLLDLFPKTRPEKVFVIPEAASNIFRKVTDDALLQTVRKRYRLERPFVLTVGSLKPHKNVPMLVQALAHLREMKGVEHDLVIVGRKDPRHPDILDAIERHEWAHYLGELGDEELACLYNLADLFVMPSLEEGFGLPVLEAMACGTPVLASNRASLPEVAGDAASLFDPASIDALENVLYNVLGNRDLRQKMSRQGLERAQVFSWEKSADSTLRVYEQVLG